MKHLIAATVLFLQLTRIPAAAARQCLSWYATAGHTAWVEGQPGKDDPFTPYLHGRAPRILQVISDSTASDITVKKVLFHSRAVQTPTGTINSEILAAIVRPTASGDYPGLLVLHGGGGTAEIEKAIRWARLGYIVVTLDQPGIGEPKKMQHSTGLWKTFSYGTHRFTAQPDITHSTIFDAVLAALQGLYLLRNQPGVQKGRVGITGISWGGYMTTMLSGLAAGKVSASFSSYGAGFYDSGSVFLAELNKMPAAEKAAWLQYLDAGRRAPQIEAPFFIAAATNDNWFYPPAVNATLKAITAPVNHFFAPNANHTAPVPGGTGKKEKPGTMEMELTWFNHYLKGQGLPLPLISREIQVTQNDAAGQQLVQFFVESKTAITDATVYYSTDTAWTKRKWIACNATPVAGRLGWYEASLPTTARGEGSWWFASVSDDRPVTVSGNMTTLK